MANDAGLSLRDRRDLELSIQLIIAKRLTFLAREELKASREGFSVLHQKGGAMSLEWGLVFQGLSALSAVVQAVKAGFETRKLTREELRGLAARAEEEAARNVEVAAQAGAKLPALDEDMIETVKGKIKKIKKKWQDAIDASDEQAEWAKATDVLKSDICSILRNLKAVNGGKLPDEWYNLWVDNGCA
jgi:gas vesicle protein